MFWAELLEIYSAQNNQSDDNSIHKTKEETTLCGSALFKVDLRKTYKKIENKENDINILLIRRPNLFFKYFFLPFGTSLFYPLRAKVQLFLGSLVGPLTLLHPKMKLLRWRELGELETMGFLYFNWFYGYQI